MSANDKIQSIEQLIRSGKGAEARHLLVRLVERPGERRNRARLAALCRRTQLFDQAARLLLPLVRGDRKKLVTPTPAETVEFAAALLYLGAADEASALLEGVSPEDHVDVLLFQAFTKLARWDYATAIPLLKRYGDSAEVPEYQQIVGKVNLAAALGYERHHKAADDLLGELLALTLEKGYGLLHGNCLELSAANAIYQRDLTKADKYLAAAQARLGTAGGLEALFVEKWKAILGLLKDPPSKEALAQIRRVRSEAERAKHWESVRDLDRFQAVVTQDEALYTHLYFGTPFSSFRRWLSKDFGTPSSLPESYEWRIGPGEGKKINLLVGVADSPFKAGQLVHQLFLKLASDFYRPFRMADLHALLYPGEYYNPASSPARVRNLIGRLRKWISVKRVPLHVVEDGGGYRLGAKGAIRVVVGLSEETSSTRSDFLLLRLRRQYPPGKPFSAVEAAKTLSLSRRSFLRILQESTGPIQREGVGRTARYRFR